MLACMCISMNRAANAVRADLTNQRVFQASRESMPEQPAGLGDEDK